jgi:protein-S-isoprenylcysteine O-methyltransferase Ste14
MCVSIPASAIAIGSWLALLPATVFVIVIHHRAEIEDQFLQVHLSGYLEYTQKVRSGLLLAARRSTPQVQNARSLP